MIGLVYGGSSSGKSEYAENLILSLSRPGSRYYIATMDSHGEEAQRRIRKHLQMREGKGFTTIECPRNIRDALNRIPDPRNAALLVESLPTLLANEMFGEDLGYEDPNVSEQVFSSLLFVLRSVKCAVVVTDNIFGDGMEYDELSRMYAGYLGNINALAAKEADMVVEVHSGIPVQIMKQEIMKNSSRCVFDPSGSGLFLVTGGFAQGKLAFVKEQFRNLSDRELFIADELSFAGVKERVRTACGLSGIVINHFHRIVKHLGSSEAALEWVRDVKGTCKEKNLPLIILCDEVGSGIIPVDPESIRYREQVGEAAGSIASRADAVYRVTLGIPELLRADTGGSI